MATVEFIRHPRTSRHLTLEQEDSESIKNRYRWRLKRVYRKLDEERSVREEVERRLENVDRLLHSEIDRYKRELDVVLKENQQAKEKLARERTKVQRLETELECRGNLLQTRTEELRNVQGILAIPDEPSDVDILRMIQHINAMAFQCSAQLVDGWTFTAGRKGRYSNGTVAHAIGEGMVEILQSEPHEEQQVVTQIAAQACFADSVAYIMSAWSFSSGSTLLADLYDALYKKGESLANCSQHRLLNWIRNTGYERVMEVSHSPTCQEFTSGPGRGVQLPPRDPQLPHRNFTFGWS